MSETEDLCSTREAAGLLGVSLRTVQLWVESGVLRAWKTAGGHRRVLRSSVQEILRRRREEVARPARKSRFTILVVEDEADLLKLYRMTIEDWKLPVDLLTAADGFEGLLRAGEYHPDMLVTDLNMPGMDGFRMIRKLRAVPEYREMRIVVVTALGRDEIEDRGGLPEDVRVFVKPVPFSQLEQLVRDSLTTTRQPHLARGAK